MSRIILASRSPARRKLLRQIGLRFSVIGTNVREAGRSRKGYSGLVVANALKKANAVAKKITSGVVIGADTVVVAAGKIIGKPKNLADAYRTLRMISGKPQWVYTGLAVVDVDNNKVMTDYERTRIYMAYLSDEQIRRYVDSSNVLDKAGSFDIQGAGGMFIDRIEGCFYNVVGLPLAKLVKMLRAAGIRLYD